MSTIERDRDVIELYKKTKNMAEVGRHFRITRERVRQILNANSVKIVKNGRKLHNSLSTGA